MGEGRDQEQEEVDEMARAAPDPPGRRRLAARHRAHGGGRVAWVQGQRRARGPRGCSGPRVGIVGVEDQKPARPRGQTLLGGMACAVLRVSLPALQRRSHKPPGP